MNKQGKSYINIPCIIPLYMKRALLCNHYNKTNLEMVKFKVNPVRFISFPIFL